MNFLFNADFLLLVKNFVLSNFFVVSRKTFEKIETFAGKTLPRSELETHYHEVFTFISLPGSTWDLVRCCCCCRFRLDNKPSSLALTLSSPPDNRGEKHVCLNNIEKQGISDDSSRV